MMSSAPRWRVPGPRVKIATALVYRRISSSTKPVSVDRLDPGTLPAARFQEHLDLLRLHQCTTSTIRDLCQVNHKRQRPTAVGRAVALTFDGSHASHADPVLPMLWERRLMGEFFVDPDVIGRRDKLSWSELRGMASAGMSIQSQGCPGYRLARMSDRELFNQLARSKGTIEDRTGYRVIILATDGEADKRVAHMAYSAGYRAVCGCTAGYWYPDEENVVVPRLPVRRSTSDATLLAWLGNRQLAVTTERIRQFAQKLFLPTWQVAEENNKHRKQGEA